MNRGFSPRYERSFTWPELLPRRDFRYSPRWLFIHLRRRRASHPC